mgnify:CR=1 FL=1
MNDRTITILIADDDPSHLLLVEAASARIARDLGNASDAALRSRAQVMADRCRAAVVQILNALRGHGLIAP